MDRESKCQKKTLKFSEDGLGSLKLGSVPGEEEMAGLGDGWSLQ